MPLRKPNKSMGVKTAIKNGTIFTGDAVVADGRALLIEGERIAGLISEGDIPSDASVWDARGANIAPGLVDLQIYGAGGYLYAADRSARALDEISKTIVSNGTTSYMLTLATNTLAVFREAMSVAADYAHPALLGLHLEGPYLNPKKRGAHPEELVRRPDPTEIEALLDSAGGDRVKIITIAPEFFDGETIGMLLDRGLVLSAGHSDADSQQATQAFDRGVQAATHLFNAMSPLHHRAPGLPGAVFLHDKAVASIIPDGIHVAYDVVKISKRVMGERLFLITDAVTSSDKGLYSHIDKGDHFALPDGTLSGSALTLLQAVGNCVAHVGIALDEALRMATRYPARVIGADDIGTLRAGAKANVLVFGPDFKPVRVMLSGEWVG